MPPDHGDGSVISYDRKVPVLTNDAFPSLFPNLPSYLSSDPAPKRKDPEERIENAERNSEKNN